MQLSQGVAVRTVVLAGSSILGVCHLAFPATKLSPYMSFPDMPTHAQRYRCRVREVRLPHTGTPLVLTAHPVAWVTYRTATRIDVLGVTEGVQGTLGAGTVGTATHDSSSAPTSRKKVTLLVSRSASIFRCSTTEDHISIAGVPRHRTGINRRRKNCVSKVMARHTGWQQVGLPR